MRIRINDTPEDIIQQYNPLTLVSHCYVQLNINRVIYGIQHADIISKKRITKYLGK